MNRKIHFVALLTNSVSYSQPFVKIVQYVCRDMYQIHMIYHAVFFEAFLFNQNFYLYFVIIRKCIKMRILKSKASRKHRKNTPKRPCCRELVEYIFLQYYPRPVFSNCALANGMDTPNPHVWTHQFPVIACVATVAE